MLILPWKASLVVGGHYISITQFRSNIKKQLRYYHDSSIGHPTSALLPERLVSTTHRKKHQWENPRNRGWGQKKPLDHRDWKGPKWKAERSAYTLIPLGQKSITLKVVSHNHRAQPEAVSDQGVYPIVPYEHVSQSAHPPKPQSSASVTPIPTSEHRQWPHPNGNPDRKPHLLKDADS